MEPEWPHSKLSKKYFQRIKEKRIRLVKNRRRTTPMKQDPLYRKYWRIVDGELIRTFDAHPTYFGTSKKLSFVTIRNSICKRMVSKLVASARSNLD